MVLSPSMIAWEDTKFFSPLSKIFLFWRGERLTQNARNLVTQLTPLDIFNRDVYGSNLTSPTLNIYIYIYIRNQYLS